MKTIMSSKQRSFSMVQKIAFGFLAIALTLIYSPVIAQPIITGISGSGAKSTGLSASWEVQWASSSSNSAIRVLYVTYENQTNNSTKLIFDAANTGSNGWEVQNGSTNSGAWKDFCATNPSIQTTSAGASATESFQL